MDEATRYPDTTRGLEYTNDLDEGVMEEGVPAYETQTNQGGKKFVEKVYNIARRNRTHAHRPPVVIP
jgi:hypothetical protein